MCFRTAPASTPDNATASTRPRSALRQTGPMWASGKAATGSQQHEKPSRPGGLFTLRWTGYALTILPLLMQLVQTLIRLETPALMRAFTCCRFGFQRRRVTLCACEMLLPNCGPLPQSSHTCAIELSPVQNFCRKTPALLRIREDPAQESAGGVVGTIGFEPTTSTVSR